MNVNRLKWTGIVTYVVVYASVVFDIHEKLNENIGKLPPRLRPPTIEPIWNSIALPKSVSIGLFSLGVTAIVLSAVIFLSALSTLTAGRDTPRDEPSQGEPEEAPSVGWNAGAGGGTATARPNVDHEQYTLRVTDRQNRRTGRPRSHGLAPGEHNRGPHGEFQHDQLGADSPGAGERVDEDDEPAGRADEDGDGRRGTDPPHVERQDNSGSRSKVRSESQTASGFGSQTTAQSEDQSTPPRGTEAGEKRQGRTEDQEPGDDQKADNKNPWPEKWVSGDEL